jgi:hypothetical protein
VVDDEVEHVEQARGRFHVVARVQFQRVDRLGAD